jgi:peptidoglycan/xylan/chitin deacetylase (PgdA/CDA1 family)
LSFEELKELIAKAKMKMQDTVGVKPRIFIPPYNEDNLNTTRAAGEEGIAVISSWKPAGADAEITDGNAGPESGVRRLPETASLSEYNATTDSWMPNSHDQIMADIRGSLDAYGDAVVMMHPRDIELMDIRAIIVDVEADGMQIASMADAVNIPKGAAASHSSGGTDFSTSAEKPQSLGQFELGTVVIAVVGASVFATIVIGRRRKRNQE